MINHNQIITKIIPNPQPALKVDRTLLADWARWCDRLVPFNTASIFWDAFEPLSCDLHAPTSSAVKDAFLKVRGRGSGSSRAIEVGVGVALRVGVGAALGVGIWRFWTQHLTVLHV